MAGEKEDVKRSSGRCRKIPASWEGGREGEVGKKKKVNAQEIDHVTFSQQKESERRREIDGGRWREKEVV